MGMALSQLRVDEQVRIVILTARRTANSWCRRPSRTIRAPSRTHGLPIRRPNGGVSRDASGGTPGHRGDGKERHLVREWRCLRFRPEPHVQLRSDRSQAGRKGVKVAPPPSRSTPLTSRRSWPWARLPGSATRTKSASAGPRPRSCRKMSICSASCSA